MSTFRPHPVACPTCATGWEVMLLEGLHITRLPAVREQILAGTFHVFDCPGCGAPAVVEIPAIYTDFERQHYVAVEVEGDWREKRDTHRRLFDQGFTFGPPAAQDLGRQMRTRLVFGYPALREKLLLWDNGFDDRVFEGLKGQHRRATNETSILRLKAVLPGGHLLCTRFDGRGVAGYHTFAAGDYHQVLEQRNDVLSLYPQVGTDWFVDLEGASR